MGTLLLIMFIRKRNFAEISLMNSRYQFVENLSVMNDDVPIVNINPAYMGVMMQTGGKIFCEISLKFPRRTPITCCFCRTYFFQDSHLFNHYICGRHFVKNSINKTSRYVTVTKFPSVLIPQKQLLVNSYNSSFFFETWANATVLPDTDWQNMMLGNFSEISLKSAQMLFDPTKLNSLTNDSYLWQLSIQGNVNATVILCSLFSINGNHSYFLYLESSDTIDFDYKLDSKWICSKHSDKKFDRYFSSWKYNGYWLGTMVTRDS